MHRAAANMPLKPDAFFDPEAETLEAIGPYSFIQKKAGNRYTADSILLVDFLLNSLCKGSKVIDLGAGTGIIPLLIAAKSSVNDITGVEIMGECASLAERNVRLNSLSSRIKILRGDFRDLPAKYPEGSFNVVVSNPPYYRAAAGRQSQNQARRVGRSEVMGGLKDLLTASRHLAGRDGRMFFVFPVSRLQEMLHEMEALGLEPRRLCCGMAAKGKEPRIFLIEAGLRTPSRLTGLVQPG